MALSETEATAMWNEPWRKTLREADAIKFSLEERSRAMDQLELDAKATAAREKLLNAPATPEEAKILEGRRISGHIDKIIGTHDAPMEISTADFARAFSTHYDGWLDKRATVDHLRDLRLGQNQPAVIVEDEPEPSNSGLHEILRRGTRK
jgi:hypothetical protein